MLTAALCASPDLAGSLRNPGRQDEESVERDSREPSGALPVPRLRLALIQKYPAVDVRSLGIAKQNGQPLYSTGSSQPP